MNAVAVLSSAFLMTLGSVAELPAQYDFHPVAPDPRVAAPNLLRSQIGIQAIQTGFGAAEWQDAVIRGVVQFVEGRARVTAMAFGVDRMRRTLCPAAAGSPGDYLVASCALLQGADPFLVPIGWGAVQSAFRTDLAALPWKLVQNEAPQDVPAAALLGLTSRSLVLLERGERYPAVVKGLSGWLQNESLDSIGALVRDWALAVESLSQMQGELSPEAAAALVLALENERGNPRPVDRAAAAAYLIQLRREIVRVDTLADQARALLASTDTTITAERKALAFSDYIAAVVGTFSGIQRLNLRAISDARRATLERSTVAAERLAEAFAGARRGDYGAAVAQTFAALVAAYPDWPRSAAAPYLVFAADLAQSRSDEAVTAVLERFALPPGSYMSKRKGPTIGVNSYVGLNYGWECSNLEECDGAGVDAWGITGPIGVEGNLAWEGFSIGVFVSAIDVGNLLSWRRDEEPPAGEPADTIETEARIGLRQIVSPGVFLTIGIPRAPLTLGIGGSVVPDLRTARGTSEEEDEAVSVRRILLFAAFDMPLVRLR